MASVIKSTRMLANRGIRMLQTRNYADASALKLTLAAANKVFYDQTEVKQVDVPSFSGDFGILATHVPTLAVLKPGVVTVYENDGATKKVFVSSGTITVNVDSSVQVLAEEAHSLEDIDPRAAQEALSASQSQLSSAKDEQERAEATLAVEIAETIVKAVQ